DGKSRLHQTVVAKDTEVVRSLLSEGAAVDTSDHLGNRPLHDAVIAAEEPIIKLLLKFGADVDARDQAGRSALHLSVSHLNVLKILIKEGVDVNVQDNVGDTALHLAVSLPDGPANQVTEALIHAKSDLNKKNDAGLTPFINFSE
ncbi:ankyrin repeat protein, partial [Lasiosphaeria ovina]